MIKKAQISFICITMSILFVVFGVVYAVTYFAVRNISETHIQETLDTTRDFFVTHNGEVSPPSGIASLVHYDSIKNTYDFDPIFDVNVFTSEQVNEIIIEALSSPFSSGQIGNVYFKTNALDNTGTFFLFIASDATPTINLFHTRLLNMFLIISLIYLILFYVVFRLSFRVFQPIKESFDKQKRFISDASHELKTPLTIISANTDVLKQAGDNKWLSNIRSQTERMDALVADMLSLAKMNENKKILSKKEINLSEEIVNQSLPFDAVAFEKGKEIELDVDENVTITADLNSLRQIVNILVDNAVKHASKNGKIKVSLKKESSRIALTVFNTGSLVPTAESHKVFERFYRADNARTQQSGGSGLGLSIAKEIADLNKWKISAESLYGVSMSVTVVFQ